MLSTSSKYLLVGLTLLTSCGESNVYYKDSREIGSWKSKDIITFSDILVKGPSEIAIALDYTDEYAYENIYIKANITTAGDTIFSDIFSVQLMDAGYWIGLKRGHTFRLEEVLDTISVENPVEMNVQLEQYSRQQSLKGIEGISILVKNL